jgi:hypothetical protein
MRIIAIGLLAVVFAHAQASAQTADETARILRDFQQRVADYTQQHKCLDMFPEAVNAARPDRSRAEAEIFTPPVAVVFRQLIARALAAPNGAAAMSGVGAFPHPAALEPFPPSELYDFPQLLEQALPPLPTPLEYRVVGHDLVVRDAEVNVIVGVVRDAVGNPRVVVR